jgi:signal transduction histidine kinase
MDGALWIGAATLGLLHVHGGTTDAFVQADGLTGNVVTALFEDREGSIWVATGSGLDCFHDFAAVTFSGKQGFSNVASDNGSVLATRDGSIWQGIHDGLHRWSNGQITFYHGANAKAAVGQPRVTGMAREVNLSGLPKHQFVSLFEDNRGRIWVATDGGVGYLQNDRFTPLSAVPGGPAYSIAGDAKGNLWIANWNRGLLHLFRDNLVEQIPWAKLGHEKHASALAVDPLHGGLWLGFYDGGVSCLADGQIRASYTTTDGVGEGHVNSLKLDQDGTLWAATEGGLSRVKDGRVASLTSKNELPCDTVHWAMEDDDHSLWLYMPCGLVRIVRSELDAWNTDPNRRVQTTIFNSSDGVWDNGDTPSMSPSVAKSADGRIWFTTGEGISVIDPRHLSFNKLPPPVHVEQITADHNVYWQNAAGDASASVHLPAQTRDLQIDYTALSFVAPEKVLFRYKLEGWDRDWQWVGNRRQAFYTNLSPGDYRFRVAASNNSGVWNEAGTSFAFSIAPAYYQTTWFRLSCVAAFLAMLWALYQLRLRQVAREFNVRMDERVDERMRIARELHDTMLQSFQGAVLHFQVVSDLISKRPREAIQKLDSALEMADQASTEGRNAVQGLRCSTTVTNDVAAAMIKLGKELSASETNHSCPEFRVDVVGVTRDLHPITRDELCRIAGEALRNAFKHAQASRIEVEIQYDPRRLRLRIRDNGRGIEPDAAGDKGRPGHYGLPGMRERAKLIGGNLELWSKLQAGTEIELTIPAAAAYAKSLGEQRARFFRKGAGTD